MKQSYNFKSNASVCSPMPDLYSSSSTLAANMRSISLSSSSSLLAPPWDSVSDYTLLQSNSQSSLLLNFVPGIGKLGSLGKSWIFFMSQKMFGNPMFPQTYSNGWKKSQKIYASKNKGSLFVSWKWWMIFWKYKQQLIPSWKKSQLTFFHFAWILHTHIAQIENEIPKTVDMHIAF